MCQINKTYQINKKTSKNFKINFLFKAFLKVLVAMLFVNISKNIYCMDLYNRFKEQDKVDNKLKYGNKLEVADKVKDLKFFWDNFTMLVKKGVDGKTIFTSGEIDFLEKLNFSNLNLSDIEKERIKRNIQEIMDNKFVNLKDSSDEFQRILYKKFMTLKFSEFDKISAARREGKIYSKKDNSNKRSCRYYLEAIARTSNPDICLFQPEKCKCISQEERVKFEDSLCDKVSKGIAVNEPIKYLSIGCGNLLQDLRILVKLMVNNKKKIEVVHLVEAPKDDRSQSSRSFYNLFLMRVLKGGFLGQDKDENTKFDHNSDTREFVRLLQVALFAKVLSEIQGSKVRVVMHEGFDSYVKFCNGYYKGDGKNEQLVKMGLKPDIANLATIIDFDGGIDFGRGMVAAANAEGLSSGVAMKGVLGITGILSNGTHKTGGAIFSKFVKTTLP